MCDSSPAIWIHVKLPTIWECQLGTRIDGSRRRRTWEPAPRTALGECVGVVSFCSNTHPTIRVGVQLSAVLELEGTICLDNPSAPLGILIGMLALTSDLYPTTWIYVELPTIRKRHCAIRLASPCVSPWCSVGVMFPLCDSSPAIWIHVELPTIRE